jgi:DNA-binding GntR family transcriptional regulator
MANGTYNAEIFRIWKAKFYVENPTRHHLSENELCQRFGVSRSPIRSVLQELRLSGLVNVVPYKGTQVTRMDFDIINQIIYQRMAVETFVLEDFIKSCDTLDLERVRHAHNTLGQLLESDAFDAAQFYVLDSQLHEIWFTVTRKTYLWESIQKSNCHYTRFRMLDVVEIKNFHQIVQEHGQIIEAIEKADVAAIRRCCASTFSAALRAWAT